MVSSDKNVKRPIKLKMRIVVAAVAVAYLHVYTTFVKAGCPKVNIGEGVPMTAINHDGHKQ